MRSLSPAARRREAAKAAPRIDLRVIIRLLRGIHSNIRPWRDAPCYSRRVRTIAISVALGVLVISRLWPGTASAAGPVGLLETNTLFAVYGRGFGVAPILGHLGSYKDMEAMAAETRNWLGPVAAGSGGKGVVTGIDLIYGLAVPCAGSTNCLLHLDQVKVDEQEIWFFDAFMDDVAVPELF